MKTTHAVLASALAASAVFVAQPAGAQSYLMPSAPEQGISIEAAHPNFKDLEVSTASSVWFVSGRLPVTGRVRLIADVPFAYAKLEGVPAGFTSESNTVLGNPQLGIEYLVAPSLVLELSARAPLTTADEDSFADVMGFLSDPQRGEAFVKDVVPVTAAVTYEHALPSGLSLRARGGTTGMFYTGDNDERETDAMLDYGLFATYAAGPARLGLGASGRWIATADEGSFSDNSLHQFGATADVMLGGVRPGISVRVPLDKDQRDVLGSSIGIYLQVPLR